jgi:starvation-inducible DNA-binding protein
MPTTTTKQRLHATRNDLPESLRGKVTDTLNVTLANVLDLMTQVKQAHWNVKGKDFYQLHELFDTLATELAVYVDEVAERVTALGGTAMGTVRLSAKNTILPEYPHDIVNGLDHVRALVERFGLFAQHVRENIDKTAEWGDADTADLYTEISRVVDKRLWFLEAHLQGE